MGRKRKENKVPITTFNISEENLEVLNSFKQIGETQIECISRILSQHNLIKQLIEERNEWEKEAQYWKDRFYTTSNINDTRRVRIEELEQILREQRIILSAE